MQLIASICGRAAKKVSTSEEIVIYQKPYGSGSLFQRQERQILHLKGDTLPVQFIFVIDGLGLEKVYLYYCA